MEGYYGQEEEIDKIGLGTRIVETADSLC